MFFTTIACILVLVLTPLSMIYGNKGIYNISFWQRELFRINIVKKLCNHENQKLSMNNLFQATANQMRTAQEKINFVRTILVLVSYMIYLY